MKEYFCFNARDISLKQLRHYKIEINEISYRGKKDQNKKSPSEGVSSHCFRQIANGRKVILVIFKELQVL